MILAETKKEPLEVESIASADESVVQFDLDDWRGMHALLHHNYLVYWNKQDAGSDQSTDCDLLWGGWAVHGKHDQLGEDRLWKVEALSGRDHWQNDNLQKHVMHCSALPVCK